MFNRIAVIRKCKPEDKDDRPDSKQVWCLYTHDGSKLLGRHPSKESAEAQERAIQVSKHSSLEKNNKFQLLGKLIKEVNDVGVDRTDPTE